MLLIVLRLSPDLPRRCARGSRGNRGPDSLDQPAVSRSTPGRRLALVGYRPHRAFSSVASLCPPAAVQCCLTSHSSRRCFATRLNSSVRPQTKQCRTSKSFFPGAALIYRSRVIRLSGSSPLDLFVLLTQQALSPWPKTLSCQSGSPATPTPRSTAAHSPLCPSSSRFRSAGWPAHSAVNPPATPSTAMRARLRPNNSFKPTLLRKAA